jgi:hypothetical protein
MNNFSPRKPKHKPPRLPWRSLILSITVLMALALVLVLDFRGLLDLSANLGSFGNFHLLIDTR